MKDFVTALVDNPAARILLEAGSGLWMVQEHLLSSFFLIQFPSDARAISITLSMARILLASVTGRDCRPSRNSAMVFCANFFANEPVWAVPRRQNKTITKPQTPVISIPNLVQCNVVCSTKETLTICYLDLYCIKKDNITKIAELSLDNECWTCGALGRFDTSTRLTSAPLDGCTTWMVCHH